MAEPAPLLEVSEIARRFARPGGGPPVEVLRGVSLRLDAGESLAVTGPSGSGKSTLLNILGGLDRPDSGSVRLGGADLAGLDERAAAAVRNRDIGLVFQNHHLLPQCTVWENVLLPSLPAGRPAGSDREARERARLLIERVGLADRRDHRPGQLSGGECQRVAVARAFLNRPRLVLADEPTGSLDAHTAAELADLLLELNRAEGTALVVATHSPALAGRLDRLARLQDGLLEETGPDRTAGRP